MAAGPLITLLPLLFLRAPPTRQPLAPGTPGNSATPDKLVSTILHFQLSSPLTAHKVLNTCNHCSCSSTTSTRYITRPPGLSVILGSAAHADTHSVSALRRPCHPLLPSLYLSTCHITTTFTSLLASLRHVPPHSTCSRRSEPADFVAAFRDAAQLTPKR